MPLTVDDQGDTAKTGDETRTKNTCTRNATDWLMRFSSRIETYAVGCATTPKLPDDTISDVTTAYDNQAVGVAPTTTSAGPNPPQTASTALPAPATSPTTPDAAH
ncbi:hypothetical protein [Streptomyces sp. NPDC056683]|uniref:hypothetical protein n=1 Tax=Streptomyces sp. NPDC056683 TaxID=3345910 RepID=UPI0036A328C2